MKRAIGTACAVACTTVLCAAVVASGAALAASPSRSSRLVWHAESADGSVLASHAADTPINPASVIKVATSAWALARLGPRHRFTTVFATHGRLDPSRGVLDGDLIVQGGGDPDFHVENAYLVARALNRIGLRRVTGRLLVDDAFWIGWEGGSERREPHAGRRASRMAGRLRDALDPRRWSAETRKSLARLAGRRGFAIEPTPSVIVEGGTGRSAGSRPVALLAVHRSGPLLHTLKRFNAYSNNDVERLAETLGSPAELGDWLHDGRGAEQPAPELTTLSGLGRNRMTPRQVVRLLRELAATLAPSGLRLDDVLPSTGCDPGTLEHFPRLERLPRGSIVAKTGTLTATDGGVVALAGRVDFRGDPLFFCAVAPRSGRSPGPARAEIERWLLDAIERRGTMLPGADCGQPVGHSDVGAAVITLE